MFSAALRLPHIKDLKDLSIFGSGETIDMQDLTDLKRCFSRERSRGTGPRATVGEASAPPLCSSRVPALDPFGSRHSRTTVSSRSVGP